MLMTAAEYLTDAERLRKVAAWLGDDDARATLLAVAEEYEELAERAAKHRGLGEPPT